LEKGTVAATDCDVAHVTSAPLWRTASRAGV
jgi:hypothetical protein